MSMISEQIEFLRDEADYRCHVLEDKALADTLSQAADTIEMLSAKARASKQGEWIDYSVGSGCYCSNCEWDGDDALDERIMKDFKYCPNCGARMFPTQMSER